MSSHTFVSSHKNAASCAAKELRQGVIAALWVPTDADGNLLKDAVAKHIDWLASKGVYGILVLGSTGEFCRFTLPERQKLLGQIAEANAGKLPLLANVSAMSVAENVALGKEAQNLGYAGVTFMTPWFYPLTQEDLLEHLLACADGIDLPGYLYNFPERTNIRIGPWVVEEFAKRANMAGIKQSGGEYDYHKELIALGKKYNFSVLSGFDTRMPEVYTLGAKGTIGGLVNMVPEFMVQIYQSFYEGKPADVDTLAARLKEVGRIIDQTTFPVNVAYGLEARGFEPGVSKIPLSQKTIAMRAKIVSELRARFDEWGLKY